MMEKPYDEGRIELLEAECRRGNFETVAGVCEEELEGIDIRRTGVVARGPSGEASRALTAKVWRNEWGVGKGVLPGVCRSCLLQT